MKLDLAIISDGGLGKQIALTALTKKLNEKYGKVAIISGYPEVFFNNRFVYRNFHFQHPYLYEDYLKDTYVKRIEPYLTYEYRFQNKHLIEAFCKTLDIEYDQEMKPIIFLMPQEEIEVSQYKQQIGKYILLQITGGPGNGPSPNRDWSIDEAQKFVNLFSKGFPEIKIIQILLPNQPVLRGVIRMSHLNRRQVFPLMKYCESFVVIDSFLNHLSAAFDKKGVVLFGGTSPERLGYKHNVNLVKDKCICPERPCHVSDFASHLGKGQGCNYDYDCMKMNAETVFEKLKEILKT